MKNLRLILILAFLGLVIAVSGWKARTFFLQNHVIFLLNQKEIPEAQALVEKLENQNPDNFRTQFLKLKTLTIAGHKDALKIPVSNQLIQHQPEISYWHALALFLSGREAEGTAAAKRFVASGDGLPNPQSMALARYLAGQKFTSGGSADIESNSFKMLFPVEQALYLSLVASAEMDAGRLQTATALYKKAFTAGLRSETILIDGVRAAALSGDVQAAEMFLAFAKPNSVDVLFEEFHSNLAEFRSPALILDGHTSNGSGRINQAQALAWVCLPYLKKDLSGRSKRVEETIVDLLSEFPYIISVQMCAAEAYEILGKPDEARALYNKVQSEAPSLTSSFRIWALDDLSEDAISMHLNSQLRLVNPVTIVSGIALGGTSDTLSIKSGPSKPIGLSIQESGSYVLTVVARASGNKGSWPMLRLELEDQVLGYQYISRGSWDCYSMNVELEEGIHPIEFYYDEASGTNTGHVDVKAICLSTTAAR